MPAAWLPDLILKGVCLQKKFVEISCLTPLIVTKMLGDNLASYLSKNSTSKVKYLREIMGTFGDKW